MVDKLITSNSYHNCYQSVNKLQRLAPSKLLVHLEQEFAMNINLLRPECIVISDSEVKDFGLFL